MVSSSVSYISTLFFFVLMNLYLRHSLKNTRCNSRFWVYALQIPKYHPVEYDLSLENDLLKNDCHVLNVVNRCH